MKKDLLLLLSLMLLLSVSAIAGPRSYGSPDISRGNFFDSTEKFIPLHHEQSRTIIIGTVDTAIRDTFKF